MRKVKLFTPFVSWWSIWEVAKVLRSGQLAEGPRVKKFEQELSKKFNIVDPVTVNSGTAALELAYELAGIGPGDEVITPVLTCTATNLPLIHRGAKIIFADTDEDLNVDIQDIKNKITDHTRAIVFVHFGGNNRGLEELLVLAKSKNIILIEDAAQAIGSDFWGKADFTAVSLQAVKTLTCGDGGFLLCKKAEDTAKAKRLRWFGYDRELKQKLGDTDLLEAGYKYHMNDISAAIGLGNLRAIDRVIAYRQSLIKEYQKNNIKASIWFAHILTDRRKELMSYLKENGIDSGIYHYRNDQYTVFGGRQSFPNMDRLEDKYLLLPLHYGVKLDDVEKIAVLISNFNNKK